MLSIWCIVALLGRISHAGELWPEPKHLETSSRVLYLKPDAFHLKATGRGSDLLTDVLIRYEKTVWDTPPYTASSVPTLERLGQVEDQISSLAVHVAYSDQSLNLVTDESYHLQIDAPLSTLTANTVFGALRGLQTFSQAVECIELPSDVLLPSKIAEASHIVGSSRYSMLSILNWLPSLSSYATFGGRKHERGSQHEKHHNHDKMTHKHHKNRHRHNKHHHDKHRKRRKSFWVINATTIRDAPRFQHRGLLIDTARHFLPLPIILAHLDAMEQCKLNVLHWHLVDDQSFPYQSKVLPMLSKFGAYTPEAIYTPDDIAEVVAYARGRGIRVVPELDTPGHTLSWGRGDKKLLTACHDSSGAVTGQLGPLDPTQQHTYTVVWKLLRELESRFPDSYVHLGGDEVVLDCWKNNPRVQAWMATNNMTDVEHLHQHYMKRVLSLARRAGRSYMVWQDVLDSGLKIANDTVVQVWKWWSDDSSDDSGKRSVPTIVQPHRTISSAHSGSRGPHGMDMTCGLSTGCRSGAAVGVATRGNNTAPYLRELQRVTHQGFRALLSSPWYLNLGQQGASNWAAYHAVEPLAFNGSVAQHALVIGGEAAMWGEYTDASNALSKTWPDAAAVAERLWSPPAHGRPAQMPAAVQRRLEEHRCRMLARGSRASPIGPGFCVADPVYRHSTIRSAGATAEM